MHRLRALLRRGQPQGGFSLIEVIISIACVALSATIILQLFLVAAYRNDRGRRSDTALAHVQSALEAFKGTQAPDDIIDLQDVLPVAWQPSGEGYAGSALLSSQWRAADEGAQNAFRVSAELAPIVDGADLPLSISGGGDVLRSQVYRLRVSVMMIRNDKEESILDITAQKHFTYLEAAQ